ncbi:DUT [Hepatospora eriocheir]|uniref:Deoxyuridine 5'-triphosphate nucleotidohydrolase n=1 Tax=Hepatospora eriocheir TaxID=1081669 RepID=A0A1X0QFM2_9MICR|nr:DUT [Hepatospora eriocheir]
MNKPTITFTKLHKDAVIPKLYTEGAAGYDLTILEPLNINPNQFARITTGLKCELPSNLFGFITGRSGFSIKTGLEIFGNVENGKEVIIYLKNISKVAVEYPSSTRITQLIFLIRKKLQ